MTTAEKENSDPAGCNEDSDLTNLFLDGVKNIKIQRCDNLFQQLETRSLTAEEQKTIDERVAFQRKLLEEYEKRETKRKVAELREVCQQLTQEEATKALELCDNKEDEAAALLTSDSAFLQQVRAALKASTGAIINPITKPRTERRTFGPRPKRGELLKSQEGVFVGSFRGKGYVKPTSTNAASEVQHKEPQPSAKADEDSEPNPLPVHVPRKRRSERRRKNSDAASAEATPAAQPPGPQSPTADLKQDGNEVTEVAHEEPEQAVAGDGEHMDGGEEQLDGAATEEQQEGGKPVGSEHPSKTPATCPKRFKLVKQEADGSMRDVTDSEVKKIPVLDSVRKETGDVSDMQTEAGQPAELVEDAVPASAHRRVAARLVTRLLAKKDDSAAREFLVGLFSLSPGNLDAMLVELQSRSGEKEERMSRLVEEVLEELRTGEDCSEAKQPVGSAQDKMPTAAEAEPEGLTGVETPSGVTANVNETVSRSKSGIVCRQSAPSTKSKRPARGTAPQKTVEAPAAHKSGEEAGQEPARDDADFQARKGRKTSGRKAAPSTKRQASITDHFAPKPSPSAAENNINNHNTHQADNNNNTQQPEGDADATTDKPSGSGSCQAAAGSGTGKQDTDTAPAPASTATPAAPSFRTSRRLALRRPAPAATRPDTKHSNPGEASRAATTPSKRSAPSKAVANSKSSIAAAGEGNAQDATAVVEQAVEPDPAGREEQLVNSDAAKAMETEEAGRPGSPQPEKTEPGQEADEVLPVEPQVDPPLQKEGKTKRKAGKRKADEAMVAAEVPKETPVQPQDEVGKTKRKAGKVKSDEVMANDTVPKKTPVEPQEEVGKADEVMVDAEVPKEDPQEEPQEESGKTKGKAGKGKADEVMVDAEVPKEDPQEEVGRPKRRAGKGKGKKTDVADDKGEADEAHEEVAVEAQEEGDGGYDGEPAGGEGDAESWGTVQPKAEEELAQQGEGAGADNADKEEGVASEAERPAKRPRAVRNVAISKRGHTCRGRVRQKSSKNAELVTIGTLRTENGWHNPGYIFPDGFMSRIVFRSSLYLDQLCVHQCSIIGKGGKFWPAPTFQVVAMDRPDEPLTARSCTGCWTAILKRINSEIETRRKAGEDLPPPPKTAIAGPEYFGLNQQEIAEAIEGLDPEHKIAAYWEGKAEREAAQAGLTHPDREGAAAAPRPARATAGKTRTSKRSKKKSSDVSEDEEGGDGEDNDAEAEYIGANKYAAVHRAERYRNRYMGDEDGGGDGGDSIDDNPLPDFIDPITLEPVLCPAISPYGHVMGYATWRAVIEASGTGHEAGICPFTKQPVSIMSLIKLTKKNIDHFRDKIVHSVT